MQLIISIIKLHSKTVLFVSNTNQIQVFINVVNVSVKQLNFFISILFRTFMNLY